MVNPFSHLEDEKLMQLYVDGEYMAFEAIYMRYKNNIYTYLNKRLKSESAVEDVFQNIFIKFHKSKDNYNSKYPLLKWIYTISKSELLDYLKKKKIIEVQFKETDAKSTQENEVDYVDLNKEKVLSSNEKEAISLRYYSAKDFDEISKVLNTSKANTRKIISRGLAKLRKKYKGSSL